MADGFDPCECIWHHENAMQRLMNLLRNSQNYCSDNVCVEDAPGPQGTPGDGGFNMMLIMVLGWIVMATALFLLRPASMRRNATDEKPPPGSSGDDNHHPPAPPVM